MHQGDVQRDHGRRLSCSQVMGKMEHEADKRISAPAAIKWSVCVVDHRGAERAASKGRALHLLVTLTCARELWGVTDRTITADNSDQSQFPRQGGWALPW